MSNDRNSLYLLAERLAKPERVAEMAACLARVGTRPEEIEYARSWRIYAHLFAESDDEQA